MNRRSPWLILLGVAAGASSTPVVSGQTSTRHYRYELELRSQDPDYASQVPPGVTGEHYAVDADSQGRITRVARIRNGQEISHTVYHFAAGANAAGDYDWFRGEQKMGHGQIHRNAKGERTRVDSFTVDGTLTGYTQYAYQPGSVEATSYNSDGKQTGISVRSYSAKGTRIRAVIYTNPEDRSQYTETEYDGNTGLTKVAKQFEGGALTISRVYTHNADGDAIRMDAYNAAGKPMAMIEYDDNLPTRRVYKGDGVTTKELRYSYDGKRWLKETSLLFKGEFICRFVYDRLSNGTVKRTLALGPDGALWAEYPDMTILDIKPDGKPISGEAAVIHKTGNWY